MQPQFSKPKGQDCRHRFSHYALPPVSAIEFISCFGAIIARIEMKETARANQSVFAWERDTPTKSLSLSVACLYLSDQFPRVIERLMRLIAIELHGFRIRKYGKQRLCITWQDVSQKQTVRSESWKVSKCSIDGHTKAPVSTLVVPNLYILLDDTRCKI